MGQGLVELREAVGRYARSFDAALLTPADAAVAVTEASRIEKMAATIKALAAARAAEGDAWRSSGHRSPAEALAAETGTTVGQARDTLETGHRLDQHPEVADAARTGQLSPTQTSLICAGAAADPASAGRLVETAQRTSVAELRDEVARTKAAATADLEARRREIHARRRLRAWTDLEGMWHLHAAGTIEDGAQIMAALTPLANERFHAARRQDRREPPDAYAFDALLQLATEATTDTDTDTTDDTAGPTADPDGPTDPAGPTADPTGPTPGPTDPAGPTADPAGPAGLTAGPDGGPTPARHPTPGPGQPPGTPEAPHPPTSRGRRRRPRRGAPVKLLVRIDYDTWLRGVARPGETCELAGYGPIPVSVVDDLIQRGDPFVAAILTRGQTLVGVAHLGRQTTATQQSALEWLYPTCAAQGCPVQARLQHDHRIDWAQTHHTMLDQLDLLCAHHHALKTQQNWALATTGPGKRPFVPPTDPRHPNHHHRPTETTRPPPAAA